MQMPFNITRHQVDLVQQVKKKLNLLDVHHFAKIKIPLFLQQPIKNLNPDQHQRNQIQHVNKLNQLLIVLLLLMLRLHMILSPQTMKHLLPHFDHQHHHYLSLVLRLNLLQDLNQVSIQRNQHQEGLIKDNSLKFPLVTKKPHHLSILV